MYASIYVYVYIYIYLYDLQAYALNPYIQEMYASIYVYIYIYIYIYMTCKSMLSIHNPSLHYIIRSLLAA